MVVIRRLSRSKLLLAAFLLILFTFANNSSLFVKRNGEEPWLLAHDGLGQTFSMEGISAQTNTARRIYPPEHPYLGNTIPSMTAAFQAGADMVEFDIQPTTDGQFAVFHDWTLDYRTDGHGVTRQHTMAELKKLDVGYGYTADGGKTYPFRGKGVGLMPTLAEVLARFPERAFLINIKSDDPREGEMLAGCLKDLPGSRLARLAVYGGDRPIAALKRTLPALRVMSKATAKKALLAYMAVGWTGYVPKSMRNGFFYLPLRYARFLWGWPHRFLRRMEAVHTDFAVTAGNGQWSEGFDTAAALAKLPAGYTGGIWTNRVDRIAPCFNGKAGK